jgi:hypothetical protein
MPDFGGLEVSAVNDDVVVEDSVSGKSVCPDCGKLLTVTAAGNIRKHKCVNDVSTGTTTHSGPTTRAARPRTPTSVRNLSVAVIASGVEYSAAASVSKWAGCKPSEVPADLGENAGIMIGPILDAIWPRLPRRAQKVIKSLADESDLLVAAMAWWEYGTKLKKWGQDRQAFNHPVEASRGYSGGEQVHESLNGDDDGEPWRPFAPDTLSVPFM